MTRNEYLLMKQPRFVPDSHIWSHPGYMEKKSLISQVKEIFKTTTIILRGFIAMGFLITGIYSLMSLIIVIN